MSGECTCMCGWQVGGRWECMSVCVHRGVVGIHRWALSTHAQVAVCVCARRQHGWMIGGAWVTGDGWYMSVGASSLQEVNESM